MKKQPSEAARDRLADLLLRRAQIWRAGLAASLRRYSREIVQAPSRRPIITGEPDSNEPLSVRWSRLPSTPGLSGLAWLGHCSTLLKIDGLTVLTDPVMSPQVGLRLGPMTVGPRRLLPPMLTADLPRPDIILISHAHFDHLDRPTLKRLADRNTRVITAASTARYIPSGFGHVQELRWGESAQLGDVRFAASQPKHWGARMGWDHHRGFNSYLIQTASNQRVFFAGDTAMTDAFDAIGPVELAIMGIGAYDPWEHHHATPEQALAMARGMRARALLPVHHSTFKLSDEPLDEPMKRLLAAADLPPSPDKAAAQSVERILTPRPGEVLHYEAGQAPAAPAASLDSPPALPTPLA